MSAVLVPNLRRAHQVAATRSVQMYGSMVSKAVLAWIAEDPSRGVAGAVAAWGSDCKYTATQTVGGYSIQAAPPSVSTCTIVDATSSNGTIAITVVATTDAGGGTYTY